MRHPLEPAEKFLSARREANLLSMDLGESETVGGQQRGGIHG